MWTFIARRLLLMIPVIVLVGILTFLLIRLIPGDPAAQMLGLDARPNEIEALRRQMGLDKPIYTQFFIWAARVVRGDLGHSIFLNQPVSVAILEHLECTLSLALLALTYAVVVSVPIGVIAAVKQNAWQDKLVMAFALLGVSAPSFWLGLVGIFVFAVYLGWFPSQGYEMLKDGMRQWLWFISLPALSLGVQTAALIARMTRSSMLEVLRQDYIRTARAKGLREKLVVFKHAFKNGLIPVITVVGMTLGQLLGGAVITETVFSLPGIGQLVITAIRNRDYPMVQGVIMFIAMTYVCANLLVDILYGWLDPRIKYA
jgi:peptide/nickel transport system permease protein